MTVGFADASTHLIPTLRSKNQGVNMTLVNFIREEDGVTAIEYGLIAALIAVAIIVALTSLGQSLESNFAEVSSALDGAI
jgi:pilus assembly protein Flp/PilA